MQSSELEIRIEALEHAFSALVASILAPENIKSLEDASAGAVAPIDGATDNVVELRPLSKYEERKALMVADLFRRARELGESSAARRGRPNDR